MKESRIKNIVLFLCFLTNISFLCSIILLIIFKNQVKIDANLFSASLILSLFSLNIAITFFIPLLITRKDMEDKVIEVVDEKFIAAYGTSLARKDSHLSRMISILLIHQESYFWALSWSLKALNEYLSIGSKLGFEKNSFVKNLCVIISHLIDKIAVIFDNNSESISKEIYKEIKFTSQSENMEETSDLFIRLSKEVFELSFFLNQESSTFDYIYKDANNWKNEEMKALYIIINEAGFIFFPTGNRVNINEVVKRVKNSTNLYNTKDLDDVNKGLEDFEKLMSSVLGEKLKRG